ncbi:MAG: hypothetical protein H6697_12805 [Myxococcales bacterium]|nr:hypothetical protein [Myxococcales bacterium]
MSRPLLVRRPAPSRRAALACAAGLLVFAARADAQPVYHATFLGNGSHVAAMNDSGTVVYSGSSGIYSRAFVSQGGQPGTLLLMPLGLLSSTPKDINEAGVIVGDASPYSTTGIKAYPAAWAPNGSGGYAVATMFPLLGGDDRGTCDAINDVGDVLGTSSYTSTTHTVAFTELGTVELPGLASLPAWDLNDQRAYLTSGGRLVHLDTLAVETLPVPAGSTSVTGWALNDSGVVAGDLGGSGCSEVATYTPGAGWQSLTACGASTTAYDVNAMGDVLMKVGGEPWVHLVGQGTFRVEDLIADDVGHWTVTSLFGIALNDERQIALTASNASTGQSGVVLLTPDQVCQADLGHGGPGTLHIAMCGGDLSTGTTSDLLVAGGKPSGTAWLFLGLVESAAPFKGGTLVPVPWVVLLPFPLDPYGSAELTGLSGGGGPLPVFLQVVVPDASQPYGFALSNALRADFLP